MSIVIEKIEVEIAAAKKELAYFHEAFERAENAQNHRTVPRLHAAIETWNEELNRLNNLKALLEKTPDEKANGN